MNKVQQYMATAYQYFGGAPTNGYQNSLEPTPQHYNDYPQPNPLLPGLNNPNAYSAHQKRISYMSRDQARQLPSFSLPTQPMNIQQFVPNPVPAMGQSPHQIPSHHLMDAQTYQQHAEAQKKRHHTKRKSNINQALPRPAYSKSRESTPMAKPNPTQPSHEHPTHQHKISNQEPITQFQEINSLRQKDKTKHHQIGSAMPSDLPLFPKETHSVASTRNPSFSLQHTAHLVDDLDNIEDIEDITEDIDGIPQPIMQHNNTRITHTAELTRMTELTEFTDMSFKDEDADDAATLLIHKTDDDDHANSTVVPNAHVASLSTELRSFQDGLKSFKPCTMAAPQHTGMPKSSLALMNTGMLDADGNLSKESILLINRVRDKSTVTAPKLDKIMSIDDHQPDQDTQSVPHHNRDVSGMSSISNNHHKYRYNNGSHRPYRSRRHKKQDSMASMASTQVLTPKPRSTRTPNDRKKFDFREDKEKTEQNSIQEKTSSNEALTTMNQIKRRHNPIGLEPIDSPTIVNNRTAHAFVKPPAIETVVSSNIAIPQQLPRTTPIAYSRVNQDTGKPKCLYRFVLSDRDKEIAIGDIVKAPIPKQMHNNNTMKFNAIIDKKEEQSDDVQVITNSKVTSHYVGIVRYLGTSNIIQNQIERETVTYLGLELMDPMGDCDGTMLDSETGEYVRPFQTKPDYAVFVSVGDVVKITPSILLGTLTDTIQKLNKHIVTLSHANYTQLQQMNKQQKHIHELNEKNKQLTKLVTSQLEKLNDIKATQVSVLGSETMQNEPISPEISYTSANSFAANSIVSSETPPNTRRKNNKNGLKPTTPEDTSAMVASQHQIQPSFASGYGITMGGGGIRQFVHDHSASMMSGVSIASTQPQLHGIPRISAHMSTNSMVDPLHSPIVGHVPTPEIHRTTPGSNHHTTVKSNMSDLELMQSGYPQPNNMPPNGTIILSNGQYAHAPIVPRMGGAHLSPHNGQRISQQVPVTPPQPVLHQVTLGGGPAMYAPQNMMPSQQYIVMDQAPPQQVQNNQHTEQHLNPQNNALQQMRIKSIPASPPKIREMTPSPQPPVQPPPQQQEYVPHTQSPQQAPNNIADIVLQSNPDPDEPEEQYNEKQSTSNRTHPSAVKAITTIRVIDQTKLKAVMKRKSQEAAMRAHVEQVNRERLELLGGDRSDSSEDDDGRGGGRHHPLRTPLDDLDRVVAPSSDEEQEDAQMQDMQRADSGEMTEIVMTKGHKPKRRRRSSVLSSHAVPPPDQKLSSDGYNAEDDSGSDDGDKSHHRQDTDENQSAESVPYRIQVTPPVHMHEERITFNMHPLAPQMKRDASNPILSGSGNDNDSDVETNSTRAEGGDKSPIPVSMQGTPNPTTPYTPYTDGEEEAKQSRPDGGAHFDELNDLNPFDEERDDDGDATKHSHSPAISDRQSKDGNDTPPKQFREKKNPYISKSPTVKAKRKRKFTRKKTITRSSTQNYDSKDPYRAPWDKRSEGGASPVSVSHGTGYDVALNALIADAAAAAEKEDSSSGRSLSLSESSSSSEEESSDAPTDHELEESNHDSDSAQEDADKANSESETDLAEEAAKHLGLFMSLNSLNCSDPIIESQGEEEEEEEDEEAENAEEEVAADDQEEEIPEMELTFSLSDTVYGLNDVQRPKLMDVDTGEIGKQSYELGTPPTRHNRQDTAELLHKKRGTLKDITVMHAQDKLDRDDQGSNDSDEEPKEYVLLLDAEEEDALSDMITPQPKEKAVLSTRFSFAADIEKNEAKEADDNDNEEEGLGELEIRQINDKYEKGQVSSITPISKQTYGVAAPPTKHNRDDSTVHDRMRLNVTELNDLLRKSPRIETIVDGDVVDDDRGSRGSVEYSSDEEFGPMELMNMESLQRIEATDSQIPYPAGLPGALHLQMSTATREYVADLGLSVEDNMDQMDLTDAEDEEMDDDSEEPQPQMDELNQEPIRNALVAASSSQSDSMNVPVPGDNDSGSSPSASATPSPIVAIPLPHPGLIVNHSVDSIGSVASDKGPVRPQRQRSSKSQHHQAARSMSSLSTLHVMNMDMRPHTPSGSHSHHLSLPSPVVSKSEDEFDDAASQGSMLIHEQVDNTENAINESMDIGDDILDDLQLMDDGMMTDEDGTDVHKKKEYTNKMKQFVPVINTKDVESIEIAKQIQNFRGKEEKTPKKSKRRKSKKAKRLHQTSPRKVHSPVVSHRHIYHPSGALHSPYDQQIFRPELDHENSRSTANGRSSQSSRRHNSVKSKRSSNRSSASSQRRRSARNERRKSKQKRGSKSRKRKSKRRHKKQHSHSRSRSDDGSGSSDDHYDHSYSGSYHSNSQQKEDNQEIEAQHVQNTMFYPQFYTQHAQMMHSQQNQQQQQQQHFQSVSLPHLNQHIIAGNHNNISPHGHQFVNPNQQPNQYSMSFNQAAHASSISHGAIDFNMQNGMQFAPQYHPYNNPQQQWHTQQQ